MHYLVTWLAQKTCTTFSSFHFFLIQKQSQVVLWFVSPTYTYWKLWFLVFIMIDQSTVITLFLVLQYSISGCQASLVFPKKILTKCLAPCNIGNHYNKEFLSWIQVTQRQTGEVLVLKELLQYDEEANSSFLKEVSSLQRVLH